MTTELLRKYSIILESTPIMEAVDYFGMFKAMVNSFTNEKSKQELIDHIKKNINWARATLKKNDRIVWFLRWYRIDLIKIWTVVSSEHITPEFKKIITKLVSRNEDNLKYYTSNGSRLSDLKSKLEHYMGMKNTSKIQNHVWTKEENIPTLLTRFHQYEEEWQEQTKSMVEIQEGDIELIKIGKQSWWILDRTTCSAEGAAMGHCGNEGSPTEGERILSFRTHIEGDMWKPHLTFILGEHGYIGESKGRANEKPAEKYHPAIITLLKHDIVKGITGGGYLPEENFEMSDLPIPTQEELYKTKIGLATLSIMYAISSPDDYSDVVDRIKSVLDSLAVSYINYNESSKLFYITRWKDMAECVNDIGNKYAIDVLDNIYGGNVFDYHSFEVSDSEVEDFFSNLPQKIINTVSDILKKEYPEEYEQEEGDIYQVVNHFADDILDAARNAISSGLNSGAEAAMFNGFKAAVDDPQQGTIIINDDFWDGEVFFAYPLIEIVDILSDDEMLSELQETLDIIDIEGDSQVINLEEPHYGWEGYDQEVAFEHFNDEL